jgi:DNA invertase Pin-like site-specific DNA recombinase
MARKSRKNINVQPQAEPERDIYMAGAYRRLSVDDSRKRGNSLENQRNIIENFVAASPDIQIVEGYEDNTKTGTNFNRPGFQAMLADCESGRINCIIVKDLTRFGRNAIDTGYYLERYLPALNVRVIAVTDGYDSNDGDGGILLPLKNVISEAYALDISRKCKSSKKQYMRDGRFVGSVAPYGYSLDPADCHHLVPNPDTADTIRYIFDRAFYGASQGEITRGLNDLGLPSPFKYINDCVVKDSRLRRSDEWHISAVTKILTDRVYCGDMVQGRSKKVNHIQINVPESEWFVVMDTHEPLISRDVFDAVQKIRAKTNTSGNNIYGAYTENIFKGKVFCARCGRPMHRHRQNSDSTYEFRCNARWNISKDACVIVSVKEAELAREILAMLHRQSEAICGKFIADSQSSAARGDGDAELREINKALGKDGRLLKSLYESMVGGVITRDEFTSMKADYEARIAALSARADEIRNLFYAEKARSDERRDLADAVSDVLANERLTAELVSRLVERIDVSPDKSFEVVFKFNNEFCEGVA